MQFSVYFKALKLNLRQGTKIKTLICIHCFNMEVLNKVLNKFTYKDWDFIREIHGCKFGEI